VFLVVMVWYLVDVRNCMRYLSYTSEKSTRVAYRSSSQAAIAGYIRHTNDLLLRTTRATVVRHMF